jgi:hypothetical protein
MVVEKHKLNSLNLRGVLLIEQVTLNLNLSKPYHAAKFLFSPQGINVMLARVKKNSFALWRNKHHASYR